MIERAVSKRVERRGGARPGAGKPKGSVSEATRIARIRAEQTGELPHELLLKWARTGRMAFPRRTGKTTIVDLSPQDRIACARACAAYYRAPYQARPMPGEQPPVVRVELDQEMVAALAAKSPDKLEVLRDVLKAIAAGGGAVGMPASESPRVDAARYGRMLSETSDVEGRA